MTSSATSFGPDKTVWWVYRVVPFRLYTRLDKDANYEQAVHCFSSWSFFFFSTHSDISRALHIVSIHSDKSRALDIVFFCLESLILRTEPLAKHESVLGF